MPLRRLAAVLTCLGWLVGCSAAVSTAPLTTLAVAGSSTSSPTTLSAPTSSITPTSPAPATTTTAAPGTGPVLPDPAFTPGVTNPVVTPATIGQTICVAGWTATVRPPASYTDRIKVLEDGAGGTVTYQGVTYPVHGFHLNDPNISHFELDHLIPLELGGNPADPGNLWMEPYEAPKGSAPPRGGSQTKDKVENVARAAICSGRLTLADAQRQVATDWAALGRQLGVIP